MTTNDTSTSRREFLAGAMGAALGAAALPLLGSSAFAAKKPAKMRFGMATYQLGGDWDIPTIIANLTKAKVHGVEVRVVMVPPYAHGVELTLNASQRAEVKKRFEDSPVKLISVATSVRFPWPEEQQKKEIASGIEYLKLSRDVGSTCIRVLPYKWLPGEEAPHEKSIQAVADAFNKLGAAASDLGQEVAFEAHGGVLGGPMGTIHAIMERVTQRSVGIRLNSEPANFKGPDGVEKEFQWLPKYLAHTMHLHDLKDPAYPYQQVITKMSKIGWNGWAFSEIGDKYPDRVQELINQREAWDAMVAQAAKA